jgi:hypothetical protein
MAGGLKPHQLFEISTGFAGGVEGPLTRTGYVLLVKIVFSPANVQFDEIGV